MSFFRICPREPKYNSYIYEDIDLKVIQKDGITINPDFDVSITDLNSGFKHFKTYSGRGESFNVTVIIHKNETLKGYKSAGKTTSKNITETKYVEAEINGELMTFEEDIVTGVEINEVYLYQNAKITTLLNYFMRNGIPFMVFSDIIGVDTSVPYLITENKSRKQEYYNYTVWELTFTRWDELKYSSFKKTNNGITNAIKKLKSQNIKKAKAKVKSKTTTKQKLAKCKIKNMVYSKNKKTVACVKYMQLVLYKEKLLTKSQVDGWYGKVTVNAVKKYQKKYAKKYNLKVTGKIDIRTFNVMIGKGKVATTTKKKTKSTNTKPQAIKTINLKSSTKGIAKPISNKKLNKLVGGT